jgi:hypothetical protein
MFSKIKIKIINTEQSNKIFNKLLNPTPNHFGSRQRIMDNKERR